MTLWMALSACLGLATVMLAWPFLRSAKLAVGSDNQAIGLAKQQLRDLSDDRARGLIGEEDEQAARAEIERRVLVAAKMGEAQMVGGSDKVRLAGVALIAAWIVIGGAVLYGITGRPDLPGSTVDSARIAAAAPAPMVAPLAAQETAASVDDMIAGLATRLQDNPDDAEGWRMLGWSHFQTGNYLSSVDAYAKAVELDGTDPVIFSVYGEAIVRSEGGQVSDRALGVFHQALALDPSDPRARFFQGMALEQRGDPQGAVILWLEILDTAPADAEWAPGLRDRIRELAAANGIELGQEPALDGANGNDLLPPQRNASGPTAEQVAAAAEMTDDERQAMIRGMVDGLAARLRDDPNDIEGWVRLLRSYVVLNDLDAARTALADARTALGTDSAAFAVIEGTATELGLR